MDRVPILLLHSRLELNNSMGRRKFGVKVGFRRPSLKKSIRARTTGKYKRKIKRMINPFYGRKGVGFIKNPRKSIRNKIYRKTTFGLSDIFKIFRK